jgi:hypothetical protein
MKKCALKCLCIDCPTRDTCPAAVRRDKRARRPMADSASRELLERAAAVLETGWYTSLGLGRALYGEPKPGRKGRMASMVKARRPLNRLRRLGVLVSRAGPGKVAEYTLIPDWREVLG